MPLLNLTGDRKQEYFTEGLAEELTSELARYQGWRVIAYQSTRRWKGKKIDPRAAGQDLVAAQKGAALEPENQITRAALAHVHFFRNERELFLP